MYVFALMRMRPWHRLALLGILVASILIGATVLHAGESKPPRWTANERMLLRSLSLASLGPLPADPSNRYADDSSASALGHAIFFDPRFSRTGTVSCATCHVAEKDFQDDRPIGRGVATGSRRTMPIAGTANSPWYFWDGRATSQWEQALGPLENPVEHGGDRTQYLHLIATEYRARYEAIFGALPSVDPLPPHAGPAADAAGIAAWARLPLTSRNEISRVYANIGKAIAAYERRIAFAPARFDRYIDAELTGKSQSPEIDFTADEEGGLRLFIGRASCVNCHNGPLFTDNHFHNTGVPRPPMALPFDSGRTAGIHKALVSEFSCTSRYSDATQDDCAELRFAVTEGPELLRAYKPPSLRHVAMRAPYMHAGQFASLAEVVQHYSDAPVAPSGQSELRPLHLSATERRQIVAFLGTLNGSLTAPTGYLTAPLMLRATELSHHD